MKLKEEIESILYCDKGKWDWEQHNYDLGTRYEILDGIKVFWIELRKQIEVRGYYFHGIKFPDFSYSNLPDPTFWQDVEESTFETEVTFWKCTFFGRAPFSNMTFQKGLKMSENNFLKGFSLFSSKVSGRVRMIQNEFHAIARIQFSQISSDLILGESNRFAPDNPYLEIKNTEVKGHVRLSSSNWESIDLNKVDIIGNLNCSDLTSGSSHLSKITCRTLDYSNSTHDQAFENRDIDCKSIVLNGTLLGSGGILSNIRCAEFQYQNMTITKPNELLIERIYKNNDPQTQDDVIFDFIGSTLNDSVSFKHLSLKNASFKDCDVESLSTSNVQFGLENGRVLFQNEKDPELSFDEIGSIYRQFKKNFKTKHDWDLAGKFYVSEMEMRRKSHNANAKMFFQSFPKNCKSSMHSIVYGHVIMWFYKWLGVYMQNAVRPLLLLAGLISLFSIFFMFHPTIHQDVVEHSSLHKISTSLLTSFGNAVPYITKTTLGDNPIWQWTFLLEKFLGTILLTFFILSLRNKFRL